MKTLISTMVLLVILLGLVPLSLSGCSSPTSQSAFPCSLGTHKVDRILIDSSSACLSGFKMEGRTFQGSLFTIEDGRVLRIGLAIALLLEGAEMEVRRGGGFLLFLSLIHI